MIKNIYKIVLILVVSSVSVFSAGIDTMGLNIGEAKTPHVQTDAPGYTVVSEPAQEEFYTAELFATFKGIKSLSLSPYLSATYNHNKDFKHHYILVGLNKDFKVSSNKFYLGLLGGYGYLSWDINPINGSQNDTSSQSYMYGAQIGFNLKISSDWYLNLNSKYLRHDYVTRLQTSATTSKVEHYESSVGLIGVSYKF